jgi:hypothetical protein
VGNPGKNKSATDGGKAAKRAAVYRALQLRHRASPDRWNLCGPEMIDVCTAAAVAVRAYARGEKPDNWSVLRECERKVIARFITSDGRSWLCKVCYLRTPHLIVQYLRRGPEYSKFGFDETASLALAAEKGLRVPRVLAFGVAGQRGWQPPLATIALFEFLEHHVTLEESLRTAPAGRHPEVMERATPALAALYTAGCNHIALKPDAIMLPQNDAPAVVIDLEYAKFYDRPSVELLAFEAAYLARRVTAAAVTEAVVTRWFEQVLDATGIAGTGERAHARSRFAHYRQAKLTRREREQIV